MQNSPFRRVSALHPEWTGALQLSITDNSLVHETHGSRGTYSLSDGVLHVVWNDFPAEDFVEVDGIYTHRNLVRDTGADEFSPPSRPVGATDHAAIQVVSLRRTPERRERFCGHNHGLNFEFFDAVDGKQVDRTKFFGSGIAEENLPYSAGAIGCALSHLALWERSSKEQLILTIVEDDAILRRDFETKSREVIAGLPVDWDLIMWGWNFDSVLAVNAMPGISPTVMMFDQNSLRQSLERFRQDLLDVHVFLLDKCFGTCAYSISPQGSRKFMRNCFPLKNDGVYFPGLNRVRPNDGIDIAMNRIYPMTNSYVSFPPLVVTPNMNSESLTLTR